jgi:PhnB protein
MNVNPYLLFNGDCEAAFKFYEQCFGAKIEAMMRHAGSPMEKQTPPERLNSILHANMKIGETILMGSDAPPELYQKPQGFSVTIVLNDPPKAERVFQALAAGGEVKMAIQKTFWAERFGMLVDKFGVPWMINCGEPS